MKKYLRYTIIIVISFKANAQTLRTLPNER